MGYNVFFFFLEKNIEIKFRPDLKIGGVPIYKAPLFPPKNIIEKNPLLEKKGLIRIKENKASF